MRDPASHEERGGGRREICGIQRDVADVVARVVERHQNHHEPAQQIDRVDSARFGEGRLGACRCKSVVTSTLYHRRRLPSVRVSS